MRTKGERNHTWRQPATCFGNLIASVWFYVSHACSVKFLTGSFTKRLQHINRAAIHHIFQWRQSFDESFV
jgi:hypothetical protein